MLRLLNRYSGLGSLRQVYQKGRFIYSDNLKYLYLNKVKDQYRCAVVVSKKVHKSAVVRNRIRRRIYEVIRLNAPTDYEYDIVIVVKNPALANTPSQKLNDEVLKLLKKTGKMS